MSKLTESVAYLKGLATGLGVDEENAKTSEQKLILQLIEALDTVADELVELQEKVEELDGVVDNIDEDLGSVEDLIYGDEEKCSCHHHHHHCDCEDELDEDYDDEEETDEETFVEYECPHCGEKEQFEFSKFDLDKDYECPKCHKPLFPEVSEEEE